MSLSLKEIAKRLDALAIDQLRAEVIRLSSLLEAAERKVEEAEYQRLLAEDHAEFWYDATEALRKQLIDTVQLGITRQCEAVAVPANDQAIDDAQSAAVEQQDGEQYDPCGFRRMRPAQRAQLDDWE